VGVLLERHVLHHGRQLVVVADHDDALEARDAVLFDVWGAVFEGWVRYVCGGGGVGGGVCAVSRAEACRRGSLVQ
jgi:hypothetical protein